MHIYIHKYINTLHIHLHIYTYTHTYTYIHIYIYTYIHTQIIETQPNNTLVITSEKTGMSLAMLWYQVLEGKIISNQQRLKMYIFTIKIMTNRNEK